MDKEYFSKWYKVKKNFLNSNYFSFNDKEFFFPDHPFYKSTNKRIDKMLGKLSLAERKKICKEIKGEEESEYLDREKFTFLFSFSLLFFFQGKLRTGEEEKKENRK